MKQKKAHATHPVGNRTVIGIICIVVALAICFGIAPLVNRLSDGKTKIVRLIRDISAGATITEADIEVADVGSYNLPTGVIKDKAQVVGKCALSNLTKGDYLFPSKIGNDTNNAGRMLESLDENHKAISITIGSFALGFSGKLETGDIVGILVYDQVENRSYTPKELAYVKVITTTTSSGVDKADVEDKSQPVTVTLASQNIEDFLLPDIKELTKPLFSIPTHQFLFNGGNINAKDYIDALQLEESEFDLIKYPERGTCLFKCGNERYLLQVKAPEYKSKLFGDAGGR